MNWKGFGRKRSWPDQIRSRHLLAGLEQGMKEKIIGDKSVVINKKF
jgi:hypothetical protein